MKKIALAVFMTSLSFMAGSAVAGSGNLACSDGFRKVATYPNSIKCKNAGEGYSKESIAFNTARLMQYRADCNAHMGTVRTKVWRKNGKWAYRVTFICANIT